MSARGFVLPVVLVFGVVLAVGIAVVIDRISTSTTLSQGLLKRKQAFYAADGIARAATEVVSAKLTTLPAAAPEVEADPDAMRAFLEAQTGTLQAELLSRQADLTPAGFTFSDLSVRNLRNRRVEQLANGPFRGMIAQVQPFTIDVSVHHNDLSRGAVSSMSSTVQRGTVSMFQFFAFIDGYAYLYTGSGARFAGRIHANGNICMGSGGGIFAEKVTSAGGFYLARSSGCRNEAEYHESSKESAWIARQPLANGLADLENNNNFQIVGVSCSQSSCSQEFDRDSTGSTDINEDLWRSRALTRWNGQLQDKTHGVPHLAVPIVGKPLAQMGRNAQHLPESNHNNTRFLVDPIVDGEPDDVRAQKFAYKADIRILNGVWYLRDPDSPSALGTPIWSDHPGTYTTAADERWDNAAAKKVGQADLFGGSNVPYRYSYYRTAGTASSAALTHNPPSASSGTKLSHRPVLSYGTLFRETSGGVPRWVPGYYDSSPCNSLCSGYRWRLRRADTRGELLQATRSGYRDGWGEVSADRNDSGQRQRENLDLGNFDRSRIQLYNMLPMNFDIGALAEALQDTNSNELGGRFAAAGRDFNGIIWIGSTWPGQLSGMHAEPASAETPAFWPFQGTQNDSDQPFDTSARVLPLTAPNPLPQSSRGRPAYNPMANRNNIVSVPSGRENQNYNEPFQRALPQPLCSQSPLSGANRALANAGAGFPSSAVFQAPACSKYEHPTTGTHARPNAVRIINGRVLDHNVFPGGLTIATNLPAVVLGDFNANSVPTDKPGVFADDWRPALIASDTVTIQSSAWSDQNAPWNLRISHYSSNRVAGDTTYHFQLLTGWLVSHNGNRDEVAYLTRLTENWCNAKRTVRGSIVIGFNAAFGGRFAWSSENSGDCSQHKIYAYDYNLDLPANQPPGAPRFEVTAVERVRRN